MAKKRKNTPKTSIKHRTNKEKTKIKLITEPAFLPNTCYSTLRIFKTEFMEAFQITKSHNHDHFWCENNIIYESYNTIRGLRFRQLIELNFNYPDKERLTETMIIFLNNIFKNNKGMKHRNYTIMVEEKPTQEEVDEYLDYINEKRKRSNVL